jgi:hypothetical protein
MTISFRQDFFDGRCLSLLSSHVFNSSAENSEESRSSTSENEIPQENSWRRVLYEDNRAFPDNYTPDTFLSTLSVNMDLTIYEYRPSVIATIKAVAVHACLIPIFFVTFYSLLIERLSAFHMICIDLALMVAGYVAREIVVRHLLGLYVQPFIAFNTPRGKSVGSETGQLPANSPMHTRSVSSANPYYLLSDQWSLLEDLKRALLVFGTLYILSPLLRTLTRSWSEDTIIAIAVCNSPVRI